MRIDPAVVAVSITDMHATMTRIGPSSAARIAVEMGLIECDEYWEHKYIGFKTDLDRLREEGRAVKLPHEGHNHPTYAACASFDEGVRMQLAATRERLAGLHRRHRGTLKERRLLLALDGLVSTVHAALEAAP